MHVSNAKQVASKKRVTTMLLVGRHTVNFLLMITISRDSSCAIYSCAIYSGKFDLFSWFSNISVFFGKIMVPYVSFLPDLFP